MASFLLALPDCLLYYTSSRACPAILMLTCLNADPEADILSVGFSAERADNGILCFHLWVLLPICSSQRDHSALHMAYILARAFQRTCWHAKWLVCMLTCTWTWVLAEYHNALPPTRTFICPQHNHSFKNLSKPAGLDSCKPNPSKQLGKTHDNTPTLYTTAKHPSRSSPTRSLGDTLLHHRAALLWCSTTPLLLLLRSACLLHIV